MNFLPARFAKESRVILRLALPVIAAQVGETLMVFIDSVMVGHYSIKDLAAIAAGIPLFTPCLVFANGVLIALSPIAAQLYGSGKCESVGVYFQQCLYLSQFIALPLFMIVRSLSPVLQWMNTEPDVVNLANSYIQSVSWGFPPAFAFMTLRFFNEGVSIVKPSMYITLIGLAFNAAANYVLIYGQFGFPAMGSVGAGWATTLAWWVMFFGMAGFVVMNKDTKPFKLFQKWELPRWEKILELLRIGLPIGLSITLEVGMFSAITLFTSFLGTDILAGHQVALNFTAMTYMIPLGLSIATTARVGLLSGRGNFLDARFTGFTSLALAIIIMACLSVLLIFYPTRIAGFYTNDTTVKEIAVQLLSMAAIFQIFDGLQVVAMGALRGLKDTRIPMLLNLISYWLVGLPVGYLLGIAGPFGAKGLWTGFITGLLIAAILNNLRFFYLIKRVVHQQSVG
jgi:MATE family multidrug resistance protein